MPRPCMSGLRSPAVGSPAVGSPAVGMTLSMTGAGLSGPGQRKFLSSGTISIGRGPGNDWVLPDPDRHLSKTHCVLSVENGRYFLTDLSTNGVHVNGARQATARPAF